MGVPVIRELPYTPWLKMKEKSTKGLMYVQVVSPNAVFGVSRVKGGRLDFLWIKDLQPNGVSLYIRDDTGSTSPY